MPFYRSTDSFGVPRAIVSCDCAFECNELRFVADDDPDFAMYVSGCPRSRPGFLHRLRHAWRILRRGEAWPDSMELDAQTVRELAEWLERCA